MRRISSTPWRARWSLSSSSPWWPSSDTRLTIIRKLEVEDSTLRPFCRTAWGRRASMALRRFCTSTWASSGWVPGLKVAEISAEPEVSTDDSKYSRCLTLESSRSIRLTTESFMACGVAPG